MVTVSMQAGTTSATAGMRAPLPAAHAPNPVPSWAASASSTPSQIARPRRSFGGARTMGKLPGESMVILLFGCAALPLPSGVSAVR